MGRLITILLAVALIFGVLVGGGLQRAGEWVGQQMVEQITPADPAPTEQPATRGTKQRRQERQRG